MTQQNAPVSVLTDGTGISAFTTSKVFKDLVADFLLTATAALATVQIMDLGSAIQTPQVAGLAIAGALVRVLYRAVLRWATT